MENTRLNMHLFYYSAAGGDGGRGDRERARENKACNSNASRRFAAIIYFRYFHLENVKLQMSKETASAFRSSAIAPNGKSFSVPSLFG